MSFFDLVENTADQAAEQPLDRARIPAENKGKNNGHQKAPKPEKLKFLKPCPICGGRDFIHGHKGGFFCISCQPGIEGLPVLALGYRKPPEKAKGLPCPTCGATTYGKEEKGFLLPDGTVTDGWTRPELFRRDSCVWPLRKWGLCWLPVWKKPNVKIKVEDSGRLIFSFTGVDGRRIEQTAFPQHTAKSSHPTEQQLCCSAA